MNIYKGNTFKFNVRAKGTNEEPYTFEADDIITVAINKSMGGSNYALKKEIVISTPQDEISFTLSSEETKALDLGMYFLEGRLQSQDEVYTLFQSNLTVKEVVINE